MDEMSIPSHSASRAIHKAFCHFLRESHQYFSCARKTYHPACSFSFQSFILLMSAPFAGLADLDFLILTSTLWDIFLLPIRALRVKTAFPLDSLISILVEPLSATAIEYLSLPESYARNNESGHVSHTHLISMYSPSAADFLSVESVILFFIGQNSCLEYIFARVLPDISKGTPKDA